MKKKKKKLEVRSGPGLVSYMPDGSDILSTEQLSARWRGEIKPETLENWRSDGKGPKYVKFGKGRNCKVVYRLAAVEEYERANEIMPKAACI